MKAQTRWAATIRGRVMAALAAVLLIAGCAPGGSGSNGRDPGIPPDGVPAATDVVAALAQGLTSQDLTGVALSTSPTDATTELETIFSGMDGITPTVEPGIIAYEGDGAAATAELNYTYPLGSEGWTYTTSVALQNVDGSWVATWLPSVVHPQLTSETRLRHQRTQPKRASINDRDGLALVEERTMFHVGIDKSTVEEAQWGAAAAQLAEMVGVDATAYTEKVLAGGAQQFVVAVTVSQDQVPATIAEVPGGTVLETSMVVPPSSTFAVGLLGQVGTPSQETIDDSNGALAATDIVGISGLQARYDEQLRGVPEVRVDLVGRSGVTVETESLFLQQSSVGSPIQLSLDRELQTKAEAVLASRIPDGEIGAIVVLDVADGGVVAAANSLGAGEYPYATFGSYAPGSTFKVVSALAMLRGGMTASSTVECPSSLDISSHTMTNYPGYPSSEIGSITLTDALAYSCNTAFAGAAQNITPEQLHDAAASLGVGTDYDAGFSSNFGTVAPDANDPIGRAISMIGQGGIEMSPLGMSAVAASVASGKTTIPWLVQGHQATSTATELTAEEASELQTMMKAVVSEGSGTVVQGVMTGAKTGTAEFGEDASGEDAHGWMIAWNDTYAVAAFVANGESGSSSAGPLITDLFS